jgi:hypothetical protein
MGKEPWGWTSMSDFRPRETVYEGQHFRSRIEARWAVFFDTLKVEWVYEFEHYDFGVKAVWEEDEFREYLREVPAYGRLAGNLLKGVGVRHGATRNGNDGLILSSWSRRRDGKFVLVTFSLHPRSSSPMLHYSRQVRRLSPFQAVRRGRYRPRSEREESSA